LIADIIIMSGGVLPNQNAIPWLEKACVLQWLINEACKQMLETNKKDKEIAFELGFEYTTYFYERFKKITGCSPGEFRARKQNPRHHLAQ